MSVSMAPRATRFDIVIVAAIVHLRHSSAIASCQDVHQFRDLTALLLLVAARDRMFDAMGNVIPQNLLLDFPQSGTNCGNLRYDVDAVTVLSKHFRKSTDLTFDAAKAFQR